MWIEIALCLQNSLGKLAVQMNRALNVLHLLRSWSPFGYAGSSCHGSSVHPSHELSSVWQKLSSFRGSHSWQELTSRCAECLHLPGSMEMLSRSQPLLHCTASSSLSPGPLSYRLKASSTEQVNIALFKAENDSRPAGEPGFSVTGLDGGCSQSWHHAPLHPVKTWGLQVTVSESESRSLQLGI
jgi:hypothetical protein